MWRTGSNTRSSVHNPTGRVWEREEIEKAMEVYARHDCIVISDEIWSDLVLPGGKHIPTQSVSEDAETAPLPCMRPVKPLTWQDWWVPTM